MKTFLQDTQGKVHLKVKKNKLGWEMKGKEVKLCEVEKNEFYWSGDLPSWTFHFKNCTSAISTCMQIHH